MQNINDMSAKEITEKINEMYKIIYHKKGKIGKTRKIEINEISLTEPREKIKRYEVRYFKNMKTILSNIFANINQRPFTDIRANPYAFEVLWILLSILDVENKKPVLKRKPLFYDISRVEGIGNTIKYGKYVFAIPKYKKYVFDVQGYNLAKLNIL